MNSEIFHLPEIKQKKIRSFQILITIFPLAALLSISVCASAI